MNGGEKFDLAEFLSHIKGLPGDDQRRKVREEMARVEGLVVRESSRVVQRQLYIQRLKRLSRFLAGEDVTAELTPSESRAYLLLIEAQQPSGTQAEQERRVSRRIAMKTRVRIRRDFSQDAETLEPVNVSRGGVGFESTARYELHEIVWVTLHYSPEMKDIDETEQRGLVVRAVPLPKREVSSYGVKFL